MLQYCSVLYNMKYLIVMHWFSDALNAARSCISVHIRSYLFISVYIWHIYAHTGGGGGGAAGPGLGDRRLPSPTPSSSG